jgi:hypothetical protein
MGLRINCLKTPELITDANGQRLLGDGCQRAIVITASVTQAITRRVKAQQRNQQNRGLDGVPVARHRDVPDPTRQRAPRAPRPELQRFSRFHHDRQGGLGTKGEKIANELTNIDLPLERPLEAKARKAQLWELLTHQIVNLLPHGLFIAARQSAPL